MEMFHPIVQQQNLTTNTSTYFQVLRLTLRELYLVHRLAYSSDIAAGQLAVFQGASEAPIPPHFLHLAGMNLCFFFARRIQLISNAKVSHLFPGRGSDGQE
jgi:hypothetical protein